MTAKVINEDDERTLAELVLAAAQLIAALEAVAPDPATLTPALFINWKRASERYYEATRAAKTMIRAAIGDPQP